jgi:3-phenylpropionate/cinnamic acid dioxygenase small subunit
MDQVAEEIDATALRRVIDELEIRNILARLAHMADTASIDELDQYLALWTEDGTWAVLSGTSLAPQEQRGHAELRAAAKQRREAGVQGPGTNSRHIVSTNVVEFDSQARARARSYFHVFRETGSEQPVPTTIGEYNDTFIRTPGGWKLQRREIVQG